MYSLFIRHLREIFRRIKLFPLLHFRGLILSIFPYLLKFVSNGYALPEFERLRECVENSNGLEIGGPTWLFKTTGFLPLYPLVANIDNCIFSDSTLWSSAQSSEQISLYRDIIISEASNLDGVLDKKYDFVISSHMIEHLSNPLKAMIEMKRAIKICGYVVVLAPHKDVTFDHKRRITMLDHMVSDFENNVKEGSIDHLDLEEIYNDYDLKLDYGIKSIEDLMERTHRNYDTRALHQHVFVTSSIIEMLNYVGIKILSVNTNPIYGIMVIGSRGEDYEDFEMNNKQFLLKEAGWRKSSPFRSDRIK